MAFPVLAPEHVAALAARGRVRDVGRGDYLWREGERGFGFFVILSGEVEVRELSGDEPRVVTVHVQGEFTGDVDVLTGRVSLVEGRMRTAGRVAELSPAELRAAVGELPEVGEILLRGFLMRRTLLLGEGFRGIRIIGSRFSPEAHHLRDFASRNAIPFTWIDLEQDQQAERLLRDFGVTADATPIVIGRDGRWVSNPSVSQLAHYMGLDVPDAGGEIFDLVVVGAGPAGLAASVYAASEGLTTLSVEATAVGGQAGTSSRIENYLGFPTGISGAALAGAAQLQAQRFGARISVPRRAAALRCEGGTRVVVLDDGSEVRAHCVLIASGAEYRSLEVPGLRELEGAGVYYAATDMEARLCRGDDVVLVGAGNSAGQAAVYLAGFARRVHVVLRGDDLGKSMSRYLVDRVEKVENVVLHRRAEVIAVEGQDEIRAVALRKDEAEEDVRIHARALFLFIGAVPHTEWLRDSVRLDSRGFVLTGSSLPPEVTRSAAWTAAGRAPYFLETSVPGVFAAGDVRSDSVKRVASAVGEGSMAVSFVHSYRGAGAAPPPSVPAGRDVPPSEAR